MTALLIDGIGSLVTNDPALGSGPLGLVADAALVVEDGRVAWTGPRSKVPEGAARERFDAGGRAVIPGFVDSHAHLVFAGDRTAEFEARMSGRPYTAGGIRTTVAATRAAGDDALRANVRRLVAEALRPARPRSSASPGTASPSRTRRAACASPPSTPAR